MKLPEKTTEVSGNLTFARSTPMRIHAAATSRLIRDAFTNIYSKQYESVLREVASNAYDAHIRAGQTEPVHIGLPDALNPNLVIEDFGIGMDMHELDMMGQYGFTDKGDTNEENGGFGLGSKSPLSICTQFTVRSIKDGLMNTVVIGFDEAGNPAVNFIDEEPVPTDLPNGTKVTIPTSEVKRFWDAFNNDAFIGWKPGSVVFDGRAPEVSVHDPEVFKPLAKNLGWKAVYEGTGSWGNSYQGTVLVGPVKYQVKWSEIEEMTQNLALHTFDKIILNIPIGEVDLISNREELRYTPRTRKFINNLVKQIKDRAAAKFQKKVLATTSPREAHLLVQQALSQGLDTKNFTFGTVKIGNFLKLDDDAEKRVNSVYMSKRSSSYNYRSSQNVDSYKTSITESLNLDDQNYIVSEALKETHAILVTEMEQEFVARSRYSSRQQYAGARSLQAYIRAVAAQEDINIRDVTLYLTAATADELGEAFSGAFNSTITEAAAKDAALEYRKQKAREARKGYAKTARKKLDPIPVRQITSITSGTSLATEVKIDTLDAAGKYIVLQKDAGGLSGRAERIIMTKVGYNNALRGSVWVSTLQELAKHYTFLHANASWKTDGYADFLPNIVTLEEAIATEVKSSLTGLSDAQIVAIKDVANMGYSGGYAWARDLSLSAVEKIDRKETREWVESVKNTSLHKKYEFAKSVLQHAESFGLAREDYSLSAAGLVSPGSRYPLLKALTVRQAQDADVVDYINWLDSK